jgi:putative nucleotidyltransferase with HDIG domain
VVVPDRHEAARILTGFDPPDWHRAHATAVADVAAFLAVRAARRGRAIDRRLVETAALLHDIDKLLPAAERGSLPHGESGARWLSRRGYPELVDAVAGHPVTVLAQGASDPLAGASLETRIVAYADKRAGQRLEPMAARFARWRRRHPDHAASLDVAWKRARRLEQRVCREAGVAPAAVRRLRWSGRTLQTARGCRAARLEGGRPSP